MATLNENIARVKADFRAIKGELVNKGASIPSGTPTSQYANIIKNISTGSSEEAYEQGRQDVISKSKYIPKTATGKVISLTDVSEVAHKVKVVGNGEVDVFGKNLLSDDVYDWNNWVVYAKGGKHYYLDLPIGTYTVSTEITANLTFVLRKSADNWATNTVTYICTSTDNNRITFDVKEGEQYALWVSNEKDFGRLYDIQIEAGQYTPYEPYTHQTITATPSGTEVSSLCPNMNFIADNDITVDYYSSFGMNEEWNKFWDTYQDNGSRYHYNYAFSGWGWTDQNFRPKYDIKPRQAIGAFNATKIKDIAAALNKAGVQIDTSSADSSFDSFFRSSYIERVPYFVMPPIASTTYMFNSSSSLHTIDGLRCHEANTFTNSFNGCSKLTHCIFSGVIANDINLQWSKLLDEESLQSLTQTLADFIMVGNNPAGSNIPEGQAFTKTITLSPESWAILDNLEFIPPEGTNYPTGFSCTNIITTAKGWNKA